MMEVRVDSAFNLIKDRHDHRIMFIFKGEGEGKDEPEAICAYFNDGQTKQEVADFLRELSLTIADE